MIKFSIVDDEKFFLSKIADVINSTLIRYDLNYRIYKYSDGYSFFKSIDLKDMDVVFLDVEISGMNGIKLANQIRKENKKVIIIFVTASPKYIYDSFGINVFAYVIKKKLNTELPKVIERLFIELEDNYIVSFLVDRDKYNVNVNDIICVKYFERRLILRTKSEEYLLSSVSLKMFSELLNDNFIFTNSHTLINMSYIKRMSNKKIILEHSDEVYYISARKYKSVREMYNDYLISRGKKWM